VQGANTWIISLARFTRDYLGDPAISASVSVLVTAAAALSRNFFIEHSGWHRRQIFVGTDLNLAFLGIGLGTLFFLLHRYLFAKLEVRTAVILGLAAGTGLIIFFLMFMVALATEKLAHAPNASPSLNLLFINLITGALPLGGALALFARYLGHSL